MTTYLLDAEEVDHLAFITEQVIRISTGIMVEEFVLKLIKPNIKIVSSKTLVNNVIKDAPDFFDGLAAEFINVILGIASEELKKIQGIPLTFIPKEYMTDLNLSFQEHYLRGDFTPNYSMGPPERLEGIRDKTQKKGTEKKADFLI